MNIKSISKFPCFADNHLKEMAHDGVIGPPYYGPQDRVGTVPQTSEPRGGLFAHYGVNFIRIKV